MDGFTMNFVGDQKKAWWRIGNSIDMEKQLKIKKQTDYDEGCVAAHSKI